ncbi:probable protein phosphatase 2C 80 [Telopea speciosissima]|uniref:probable protein phosphatase 2C 80 n=1 Tax=Telopea speciosissima TaxID=54955 RepID=UPI001CC43758|nr:probable protein phosphatase 2C 80 [Telopea speciosissima]
MYPYYLAQMIAENAEISSKDCHKISPFSLSAEIAGYYHSGGKKDDITKDIFRMSTVVVDDERPSKVRRLCCSDSSVPATPFHGIINDVSIIPRKRKLKLLMGSSYLPKENLFKPEGEDAHFICEEQQVFGVADGVGSWAKKGIDAGEYARELMSNSVMAVQNAPINKGYCVDPLIVLEEAFSNTNAQGSSTACILALADDDNCLHYASVGDSGFLLIRGEELIYNSPSQQRRFNCPFQLGKHPRSDNPTAAFEFKVEVEEGDVIVAGTDGLFDNLFQEEIIETVNLFTACIGMYPYYLAKMIAENAEMSSKDSDKISPFSVSTEMAGYYHSGGKKDDITVVVAYVVPSSS